nr:meiotic coiled-coil protein 2 [Quercus suber]
MYRASGYDHSRARQACQLALCSFRVRASGDFLPTNALAPPGVVSFPPSASPSPISTSPAPSILDLLPPTLPPPPPQPSDSITSCPYQRDIWTDSFWHLIFQTTQAPIVFFWGFQRSTRPSTNASPCSSNFADAVMDSSRPLPSMLPPTFSIFEDRSDSMNQVGIKSECHSTVDTYHGFQPKPKHTTSTTALPLTTSKLMNLSCSPHGLPQVRRKDSFVLSTSNGTDVFQDVKNTSGKATTNPVDNLLAKLVKHQAVLNRRKEAAEVENDEDSSSSGTEPSRPTPATASLASSDDNAEAAEVLRLKKELELAQERMAQMDLQLAHERDERMAQAEMELTQSRIARHTVEEAIGSPFPAAQHLAFNMAGLGVVNANVPIRQTDFRGRNSPFEYQNLLRQTDSSRPPTAVGYQTGYTPPITPLNSYQPSHGSVSNTFRAQPTSFSKISPSIMSDYPSSLARQSWSTSEQSQSSSYLSTAEPLNYRRLLDRNMSCNWKYIVDKIVCNNDQQASIFLQQKLKVGTAEQKFEIVQAIIDQAYPLMVNRFGNFLVQRCFEHGTPEQIVQIAQAIRGNTLNLSMDAFGCHVVQKAFDCVPEEYKTIMVHELLRRIPETVIHRYACHVWQKLFELRWSDSPPQIMKYVNEALRGMWHEVALGETGSLVVQNIFENCLEEDKRACITEVLASIDVVAHGQFGNWCIQHICEHGATSDRTRAIDHVIRFAAEYSMDQFASKVVEKCLKVGGTDFLDRFLDRVCEPRQDRPRMPMIDIAGDQFGNYLIQYILTNADSQRRELVATQIRKHMVSLRGSKYGSRVAMLCCNPAVTTRPGPPGGMGSTRGGNAHGDGYGSDYGRNTYANERASGGYANMNMAGARGAWSSGAWR